MTHDHSQDVGDTPPDRGSAGDVSTTGQSALDTAHSTHGGAGTGDDTGQRGTTTHDAHATAAGGDDAHGAHGGHGADTSDVPTLVPTTWRQLIFPALILLLVAILVAGPVSNAFSPRPAAPSTQEGGAGAAGTTASTAAPTEGSGGAGGASQNGTATVQAPATMVATVAPQASATSEASPTSGSLSQPVIATRTAVAGGSADGAISGTPVQLRFANTTFTVQPGNDLLPDWKPSQDPGTATWIDGTYSNHILYLPYSEQNAALFTASKAGDEIKVTMNTGRTFFFSVTRAEHALDGPAPAQGQFTVTGAMAQDHTGVTLFLVGDPAEDRAVVQAEFTGTIQ